MRWSLSSEMDLYYRPTCVNEPFHICLFLFFLLFSEVLISWCFILNNNFTFLTSCLCSFNVLSLSLCSSQRWVTVSCVWHDDSSDWILFCGPDVLIPAVCETVINFVQFQVFKPELYDLIRSDMEQIFFITPHLNDTTELSAQDTKPRVVVIKQFFTDLINSYAALNKKVLRSFSSWAFQDNNTRHEPPSLTEQTVLWNFTCHK